MTKSEFPSAILLFGVAGVGKTYLGSVLSKPLGFFHYELDRDLTPAMCRALDEGREFTDPMRDEFFTLVAVRMQEVLGAHERVIFTQGAYKERHRAFLRSKVAGLECIWVTAPDQAIEQRLAARGASVSGQYAKLIYRNFEKPSGGKVFINDTSVQEDLVGRFKGLFQR